MSPEDLATERLILIALMKAFSEQSTYLTGELKYQLKQDLNNMVKRTDDFVNSIEKRLNEPQKEYLQSITDIYHNINLEIRKNLKTKTYAN